MRTRDLFTESDLKAIRSAASSAELGTSGEVVTYVVGRCDDYPAACWRSATFGAILASVVASVLHGLGDFWGETAWWIATPAALGAVAGYALPRLVSPLRRWLIPRAEIEQRIRRRAAEAFLAEEVFKTRDRTGILLFLALFERRVVVLADEGINALVAQSEWKAMSDRLATSVRAGRAGAGLVEAIGACGDLLRERGVAARPDDRDELRNELRMHDE